MERKHNGSHNELVAAVWLLKQGYEVFQNLSTHGAVDLIAMKGGKLTLFDVKKTSRKIDGGPMEMKLKAPQIAMGVKVLCVFEDDECFIIEEPKLYAPRKAICAECNKNFLAKKPRQILCSKLCRQRSNKKKYPQRRQEATAASLVRC